MPPLARYPRGSQLAVVVSKPETGHVLRPPLATGPRLGRIYTQAQFDAGSRQVAVAVTHYPPGRPAYTEQLLLSLALANPA